MERQIKPKTDKQPVSRLYCLGQHVSTIRVAVKENGGFAPFVLGFTRVLAGDGLLLLWGVLRGERIIPSRQELIILVISGLLLWVGGNGLVNWAEQRINSGLTSLILAATQIWVAIIESVVDRKLPSWRTMGALLVGFGG